MDAGAVGRALQDARFDARQDSRHEHLADDERGRAELAEWERIDQLLAAAAPGTVYDPDTDTVVQAEFAADAAAAAGREAELREGARIEARADKLQALRGLGTLEQAEPREGDEAARDELTRRAGGHLQADVVSRRDHFARQIREQIGKVFVHCHYLIGDAGTPTRTLTSGGLLGCQTK
jgi:hypothetical protein